MESLDERAAALDEQKKACIFCKIIAGEIPAKKVYEDSLVLVILDINPATKGHVLVVPKEHYPILPLVPPATAEHLATTIRRLTIAAREGILAQGTTVFVANGGAAGQQSQHFLLHVIPREEGDGIDVLDIPSKPVSPDDTARLSEDVGKLTTGFAQRHYQQMKRPYPGRKETPSPEKLLALIEQNRPLLDAVLSQPDAFKKLVPTHPQLKDLFAGADIDAIIRMVQDKHGKKPAPPSPAHAPPKKEERREGHRDGKEKKEDEEEDVFEALGGIAKNGGEDHDDDNHSHAHDGEDGHGHSHGDKSDDADLDEISRMF